LTFAYRTTAGSTLSVSLGTLIAIGHVLKQTTLRGSIQGENMKSNTLSTSHLTELLYQALETEKGGVQIYSTALRCALNEDLKEEWNKYLEQTKEHVQIVSDILKGMNLDTEVETPGRKIVRHIGDSLVQAMEMALRGPDLAAAQIVAAECVTLAETKDHLNWELIGEITKNSSGDASGVLKQAYDQVEPEEDAHLYHTTGWTRELWIEALGMPAVLPPPEEEQDVENAIEAANAKKSRAKTAST
jgi:rubrerythrin